MGHPLAKLDQNSQRSLHQMNRELSDLQHSLLYKGSNFRWFLTHTFQLVLSLSFSSSLADSLSLVFITILWLKWQNSIMRNKKWNNSNCWAQYMNQKWRTTRSTTVGRQKLNWNVFFCFFFSIYQRHETITTATLSVTEPLLVCALEFWSANQIVRLSVSHPFSENAAI